MYGEKTDFQAYEEMLTCTMGVRIGRYTNGNHHSVREILKHIKLLFLRRKIWVPLEWESNPWQVLWTCELASQEKLSWERGCTVYTHAQDHLRFQDHGQAVYSDSLVIDGRKMCNGEMMTTSQTNQRKKCAQKWLVWLVWLAWLAPWLAWLAGSHI